MAELKVPVVIDWDDIKEHVKDYLPHWISCSERLPEEYGEYFITWTTADFEKPLVAICEAEETGEWDSEHDRFKVEWLFDDYMKLYSDVKVIAWMPLPEPYREVEYE